MKFYHDFLGEVSLKSHRDEEFYTTGNPDQFVDVIDSNGDGASVRIKNITLLEELPPVPMNDLNALAEEVYQNEINKGWKIPGETRNFGETCALIISEISEALEHYRNHKEYAEVWYEEDGKPDGIPIEMADAIIRILGFCAGEGIDINRAIRDKIDFNKSRPYRHGGKRA